MIKDSKLYKSLDNFWYHNKWYLPIVIILGLAIIISLVQCGAKKDPDINLLYTGPHVFSVSEIHEVELAFEQIMSSDRNGDGTKNAALLDISLMTDEQFDVAQEEAREMGIKLTKNPEEMQRTERQFNTQIFTGDSIICLLDPHWYAQVKEVGGFVKLTEVLGYAPELAIDEYGIRLFDTDFGKYFTAFDKFPEDTIICVRNQTVTSMFTKKDRETKRYEFNLQVFRDAMNFKLPEGWTEITSETSVEE